MAVGNFGKEQSELAPGVAGSHMVAGYHTEPDREAASGRKVEAVAHLAFDNPFEFEAQSNVLKLAGLGSSGPKVDLVGFEMDLAGQQDELAGCPVVRGPPRVVLAEQMTELAEQLVGPEVGQFVQINEQGGQRVDLAA